MSGAIHLLPRYAFKAGQEPRYFTLSHTAQRWWYDDLWMMNWKGFRNERSRPSKAHVLVLSWNEENDRPQSRRCVPAEIRTWHLHMVKVKQSHYRS
jgi:hypothetical protein